jgi:D-glycero-alpha-D-manno-heptose-7-phosphate kinase
VSTPRFVRASAPVRICDLGGWTDTWFARHGVVCHLAVKPGAEVHVVTRPRGRQAARVVLDVEQFGDRYGFDPHQEPPGRHPLLETAMQWSRLPDDCDLEITVRCALPPGSATGTSAAVVVALLGALDALTPGRRRPDEIAAEAHRLETEGLGLQSGIQDQLASAHGGINLVVIDAYPHAQVARVPISDTARASLQERTLLVYLGRPHRSSQVHDEVIASLDRDGDVNERLKPLREAARRGASALADGDLDRFGLSMIRNTMAQHELHPDLVSRSARQVIDIARRENAAGWKVNGAGGSGGSITVLGPSDTPSRARLAAALQRADRGWRLLPVSLSEQGLRIETSAAR